MIKSEYSETVKPDETYPQIRLGLSTNKPYLFRDPNTVGFSLAGFNSTARVCESTLAPVGYTVTLTQG